MMSKEISDLSIQMSLNIINWALFLIALFVGICLFGLPWVPNSSTISVIVAISTVIGWFAAIFIMGLFYVSIALSLLGKLQCLEGSMGSLNYGLICLGLVILSYNEQVKYLEALGFILASLIISIMISIYKPKYLAYIYLLLAVALWPFNQLFVLSLISTIFIITAFLTVSFFTSGGVKD